MPERSFAVSNDTDAAVAELVAAALRLPVFLVFRCDADTQGQWYDPAYASIAERWRACSEDGLPPSQAAGFVSAVANVVAASLDAHYLTADLPDPPQETRSRLCLAPCEIERERRHRIWEAHREVLLGWLQEVRPAELGRLAQAWRQRCDKPALLALASAGTDADDTATQCTLHVLHSHPAMSGLRTRLLGFVPAAFDSSDTTQ